LLREYGGYTLSSLLTDMDEHPELVGGLLAVVEARGALQELESGTAKLNPQDVQDNPKKAAKWAEGRKKQSKRNLAGADATLAAKFPQLMR
jgi:hypothetical protein